MEIMHEVCKQDVFRKNIELYTFIPCRIKPDKPDHNKLTCSECVIFIWQHILYLILLPYSTC